MAREKATNDIPIEDFDQEVHDPEEYFERFESAMELATGVTDDARKAVLLKKWLQIKLNAAARMILKSCDMSAEWEALIAEFKSKLITPQDRYNWRSGKRKITWDGRESFHVLAERVKRTVDRYEDQPREKDYFYEFRQALPKNYRQAIDFGSEGVETLETAKKIALKLQAALSGSDADESSVVAGGKSVSFVGASMSEDWMDSMEKNLAKLTVSLENQNATIAQLRKESRDDCVAHCGYESLPRDYSREYRHRDSNNQWGSSGDTVFESHSDTGLSQNRQYDDWIRDRRYENGSIRDHFYDKSLARDHQLDRGSSCDFPFDNNTTGNRPSVNGDSSDWHRDNGDASCRRYEHDSYRQQNEARPSFPSDRRCDDSFSSDRRHIFESRQQRDGGKNDYHLPPLSYQW